MNRIERLVYDLVKSKPSLKVGIRNIYQRTFDLLPKPKLESAYPINERVGYFFGFHDCCPFSVDNSKLLANRALFDLKMPKVDDTLLVGYFEGDRLQEFNPIAETRSWNWHMGCRLQWRGSSDEIIFNDYVDDQNIARHIRLQDSKERILPDAISSVSNDGRWAVGYSFSRVEQCMPGYGYRKSVLQDAASNEDSAGGGVYRIDLESGTKSDIVSLKDLIKNSPTSPITNAKHFVTHTQISPDSTKLVFLHRWIDPCSDISKRHSALIVCDSEGNNLRVLETKDMVSHITWRGSDHIVAYCRTKEFGDAYVQFCVGSLNEIEAIGLDDLVSDGHPSFDITERWMVTDTYPNRRRVQTLTVYDMLSHRKFNIARIPSSKLFQSPSVNEHWSCDLHPRWDRKSRYICFDSTHSGQRSLCTIDLGDDLIEGRVRQFDNAGQAHV